MYKVIKLAIEQEGYLEKKTNAQLDDKTANAGSNNWNKFARDLDLLNIYNGKKNGYHWCDIFVDWCFITGYGEALGLQMTYQPKGGSGAGCTSSASYYKRNNAFFKTPVAGDQIFFTKDKGATYYHTGLVIEVSNGYVYTIEGNTSSLPGVVENGGCVRRKSYPLSAAYIGGYGRPNYALVADIEKGELDMDETTLRRIIKEEIEAANKNRLYKTYAQVPDVYKPAIQWLFDQGLLNGYDGGTDLNVATKMDNTINVDETFCRLAFVAYNAITKGIIA